MEGKKRWADYTDSDSELETSVSVQEELADAYHLPYYLKIMNFPYTAKEIDVVRFLSLDEGSLPLLKLLYSRGSKKKFRGVAILTVRNQMFGGKILELDGACFSRRKIKIEVMSDWKEH